MMEQPKPLIVAISGKMRSGKTYCADELVQRHGAHRLSFAGPLKDDIRGMGFPGSAVQQKPAWMRQLMQAYGQARRAVDPDHWAKQLVFDARNRLRARPVSRDLFVPAEASRLILVIDDMRFPNEAEALRVLEAEGGCEVRLVRLERVGEQAADASHTEEISETALDVWTDWWQVFRIQGGDLHGLRRAADQMVR